MARLNVQGLARKDKRLMSALVAPEGYTYVSCDLASGEPTCIAHFSKDKNYYDATFGMVGKLPYYDGDILRIGGIYPMVASVSPIGKERIREIFNSEFDGLAFPEAYVKDTDLIKKLEPKLYALHKVLALGLGYMMGPKKLVTTAYDAGHILPFKTAKEFYGQYWGLYKDVHKFAKMLESKYKRDGVLVNPFGYALYPDKPYKALNYYIQSSVSGIMHVLRAKYAAICPYVKFVTVIHDELVLLIPTIMLTDARELMKAAEASLNEDLGWSVKIRVGWAEGKDMYEAK